MRGTVSADAAAAGAAPRCPACLAIWVAAGMNASTATAASDKIKTRFIGCVLPLDSPDRPGSTGIGALLRPEEAINLAIRRYKLPQHSHLLGKISGMKPFDRHFSASLDDFRREPIANHSAGRPSFEGPPFHFSAGVLNVDEEP